MTTLEEKKKNLVFLIELLYGADWIRLVDKNTLLIGLDGCIDAAFEAGQQAANKAHQEIDSLIRKRLNI